MGFGPNKRGKLQPKYRAEHTSQTYKTQTSTNAINTKFSTETRVFPPSYAILAYHIFFQRVGLGSLTIFFFSNPTFLAEEGLASKSHPYYFSPHFFYISNYTTFHLCSYYLKPLLSNEATSRISCYSSPPLSTYTNTQRIDLRQK